MTRRDRAAHEDDEALVLGRRRESAQGASGIGIEVKAKPLLSGRVIHALLGLRHRREGDERLRVDAIADDREDAVAASRDVERRSAGNVARGRCGRRSSAREKKGEKEGTHGRSNRARLEVFLRSDPVYEGRMDRSPAVSVPRLRTKRLLLREYRMQDFDDYAANLADPEATKFVDTADRKTALRMFAAQTGLWVLQGAGWWAVELHGTGERVGNVGAFFREEFPDIEIGWTIYRSHWRNGYGFEAAAEVVRHAFEDRKAPRVTALINRENIASVRIAEKCGMTYESNVLLWGKSIARWALSRPDTS